MGPFHVNEHGHLSNDAFALRQQATLLDQLDDRAREMAAMQQDHRRWLADSFPDLAGDDRAVAPLEINGAHESSMDTDASDLIGAFDQFQGDNGQRDGAPGELLDKQHELRDRWLAEANRDLVPSLDEHDITVFDDEPDPVLLSHGRVLASDTVRSFRWRSYQPFPGGANVTGKAIHRNQNEIGQFSRNGSMRGGGVPLMLANTVHTFRPRWLATMGTASLSGHLEMWAELEYDTAHYSSFVGGLPGGPDLSMVSAGSFFTLFGSLGPGASPTGLATVRLWSDETEWFRFSSNNLFNGKVSHHPVSKPIWVRLQDFRPQTLRFDGGSSTVSSFSVGLLDTLAVSDPTTTVSYVSSRSRWKLNRIQINLVR